MVFCSSTILVVLPSLFSTYIISNPYLPLVKDCLGRPLIQLLQRARNLHDQGLALELRLVLQPSKSVSEETALCIDLEIQDAVQLLLILKEVIKDLMWVVGIPISS